MASKEVQGRCRLVAERLSESFHILDHDPSMALYRLQEHVNKTVPVLVNRKYDMMRQACLLQNATYDIDNSIEAITQMQQATDTFENILSMLRQSTFVKQQMDYKRERSQSSLASPSRSVAPSKPR